MRIIRFAAVLFCLSMQPHTAYAQLQLPREAVENVSRSVHDHMAGAMISNDHIITEDEAKKLQYPLLPYDLREELIKLGSLSGMAQWCGLDWKKRNFFPLMAGLRSKKIYNDYQLAYAGMLHGHMQSVLLKTQEGKICDDAIKANIDKNLTPIR
ncbi:MAG: hypothetical protein JWO78_2180 [Micavibrio sp.]|nr:hypothetical protein [Micavibrio sp.]